MPLAVLDDGGHDQNAAAFGHLADDVNDLLRRLLGDGRAAVGAVGVANARIQEAQVVVDFGDGADGRAGVASGALLVDGDGRAESLDLVDVGLLHEAEELARIGGEGLDVAALPLGVDGVEGEAAFAAAAQAGDDHELIARHLDVDILEVVFARAAHDQLIQRHGCPLALVRSHD